MKKKSIKQFILLSMLVIMICQCDYVDSRLTLKNETDRIVFFRWQEDSILNNTPVITNYNSLPKESLTKESPLNTRESVLPHSENNISIWTYHGWNKYFNKNKFVYIFIFDKDTLNKYKWEEIRSKNKYLKRLDLSFNDIKKMEWKLIYSNSLEGIKH
jgi:hypothetical protein